MTTQRERIRALNDELRQHLLGGAAVITPGDYGTGDVSALYKPLLDH